MGPDITVSFPAAALFPDAPPRFGQQDSRSFQPDTKTEEEALEEEDWLRQKIAEARQKRRKQVRATAGSKSNLQPLSCLSTRQIYKALRTPLLPLTLGLSNPAQILWCGCMPLLLLFAGRPAFNA